MSTTINYLMFYLVHLREWLADRIWPFSRIRELQNEVTYFRSLLHKESTFAHTCLVYLDKVHPSHQHFDFEGELWIMDEHEASKVIMIEKPRMSYKVEGVTY